MLIYDILVQMSYQSDKVKAWRKNTKQRIMDAFGGQCAICKYSTCPSAIDLHHLDPLKKDFSFGSIRANPKSWEKIVVELRKCVMLCKNCHAEVHAKLISVPTDAPIFNEEFANYKRVLRDTKRLATKTMFTPCLYCGVAKPHNQRYCSIQCAGRSQHRVDWEAIDLLFELQTKSVVQVATELGVSDSAVHKRKKKLLGL